MPIYLMSIRVLLSVEFCVTLKTYLKGAPFYNAFLRAYEGVSFTEAVERTKYDLGWKVALGLEMEEVRMQKSALQEFEAKLVLHEMEEPMLKKSIEEARRAGYLKNG